MYLAESQVLEIAQDLALDGFDVSTLAAYMPQWGWTIGLWRLCLKKSYRAAEAAREANRFLSC